MTPTSAPKKYVCVGHVKMDSQEFQHGEPIEPGDHAGELLFYGAIRLANGKHAATDAPEAPPPAAGPDASTGAPPPKVDVSGDGEGEGTGDGSGTGPQEGAGPSGPEICAMCEKEITKKTGPATTHAELGVLCKACARDAKD